MILYFFYRGLGKTIISLSLILVNPAPALPASGSPVGELASIDNSNKITWDKDLYSKTSTGNIKRGQIISRGTLVVCPVSLVGQWVEEAKSRLTDPGMVYSYHGQNRKRDPLILAKNAIVVTTYETLKSDRNYHKKKAKNADDYVAPLEQVRWWRLICDEAHSTRSASKSGSVMDLVADHRWLVSGTPVSTSLCDLKNQLKVIGLEDVEAMFSKFARLLQHIDDRGARKKGRRSYQDSSEGRLFGHFMFLMRSIMMRHAQSQVYRGTNPRTTLMSLPKKVSSSKVPLL